MERLSNNDHMHFWGLEKVLKLSIVTFYGIGLNGLGWFVVKHLTIMYTGVTSLITANPGQQNVIFDFISLILLFLMIKVETRARLYRIFFSVVNTEQGT